MRGMAYSNSPFTPGASRVLTVRVALVAADADTHLALPGHGDQPVHQMLLADDSVAPPLAHDEKLALDLNAHTRPLYTFGGSLRQPFIPARAGTGRVPR